MITENVAAPSDVALEVTVGSETHPRLSVLGAGDLLFGGGASAEDLILFRFAVTTGRALVLAPKMERLVAVDVLSTGGEEAGSLFIGARSRGTVTSQTALLADDFITSFEGHGHDGTGHVFGG